MILAQMSLCVSLANSNSDLAQYVKRSVNFDYSVVHSRITTGVADVGVAGGGGLGDSDMTKL